MKRSKIRQRRLEQRVVSPPEPPPPSPAPPPANTENRPSGPPAERTVFTRQDLFLYPVVVTVLFLATGWNTFHTCVNSWFWTFLRGDDNLVADSLVRHRATSRIPAPVGLGYYDDRFGADNPPFAAEFRTSKEPSEPFHVYRSQIGGQGYFFVLLDSLFHPDSFDVFHVMNAFLAAAVLALLVVWARAEFGWFAAVNLMAAMLLSPWLIVFGRNLYWMSWVWWLPLLATGVVLNRYRHGARRFYVILFLAAGVFAFAKCSAGYEFTSTILIAGATPAVYYGLKAGRTWKSIAFDVVGIGCAGIAAFLAAVLLQAFLLGPTLSGGLASIWSDARRRTYGSPADFGPEYRESLQVSPLAVVHKYLWLDSYINSPFGIAPVPAAPNLSKFDQRERRIAFDMEDFHYGHFLLIFAACGFAALCLWRTSVWNRSFGALLAAAAFSIAAPFSWFVLGKGHSWIHTHIDWVIWHIPFVNLAVVFLAALLSRSATSAVRAVRALTIGGARTSP